MSLAERANLIEAAKGCTLCTDWSGDHQKDNCDSVNSKGELLKACQEKLNGTPCGRKHHPMLHGSSVQYCNMFRGGPKQADSSGSGTDQSPKEAISSKKGTNQSPKEANAE